MTVEGSTPEQRQRDAGGSIPHKILVAVADGGLSEAAVEFASRLVEASRAEIDLLHVLPVPTLPGLRLSEQECSVLESERRELLAQELTAYFTKTAMSEPAQRALIGKLRVLAGQPAKVLLEQVREKHVDLLVLGTSGKRKELDFGGVARAVLSQANCPVLLVPQPARRVRKLLVPVDLSPASMKALAIARDWAQLLGARLLAIHCFSVPELAVQLYVTALGAASVSCATADNAS